MCFVENKSDVAEEYRRVDKLLRDLRVMAELHVHYLRGAGLSTYDEASNEAAVRQNLPPKFSNIRPRLAEGSVTGQSASLDIKRPKASVGESSAVTGAFSMKVNLPMPLRYEASRTGRHRSSDNSLNLSSGTTSSSEDDSDPETDSPNGLNGDICRRTSVQQSALPRFATISGTDPRQRQNMSLSGGAFWRKRRSSADPNRGRHVIIGNLPLGSKDVDIKMRPRRRGSDGAMVLSDFYSRTLAAVASQVATSSTALGKQATSGSDVPLDELSVTGASPPTSTVCPGSALKSFTFASAAALPESVEETAGSAMDPTTAIDGRDSAEPTTTDFNDMPVNTQNRILNEMIRHQCDGSRTALIFTTLQAPEPGTSDSEQKAMEYLRDIDALAHGLPPVFLVHATSLTVTTSL
ncbi:hypothetical protein GGI03_002568 [Coemansia sp. RSA 2337]|nr:hypothetical protein H4S04_002419 [Coemansia sp. S16]KAJ2465610.1 hypothetical protein GGI03_002568 [Coemansia sp. RSA 2337]